MAPDVTFVPGTRSDHLNQTAAVRAGALDRSGLRAGDQVTYDLKPSRTDPTAVGTSQFAAAAIEEMNA